MSPFTSSEIIHWECASCWAWSVSSDVFETLFSEFRNFNIWFPPNLWKCRISTLCLSDTKTIGSASIRHPSDTFTSDRSEGFCYLGRGVLNLSVERCLLPKPWSALSFSNLIVVCMSMDSSRLHLTRKTEYIVTHILYLWHVNDCSWNWSILIVTNLQLRSSYSSGHCSVVEFGVFNVCYSVILCIGLTLSE